MLSGEEMSSQTAILPTKFSDQISQVLGGGSHMFAPARYYLALQRYPPSLTWTLKTAPKGMEDSFLEAIIFWFHVELGECMMHVFFSYHYIPELFPASQL